MGDLFGGAKKIKDPGLKMDPSLLLAEKMMIQRQDDIASGRAPSYAKQAMDRTIDMSNKNAMSFAASGRGASSPSLAMRTAQLITQQNLMDGAQQSAMMETQQRQQADQMIGNQASAGRGVAMNVAAANQNAETNYRNGNMQMIGNLGAAGAMALSDETKKDNKKVTKESALKAVTEFLDSVEPYQYNYEGDDIVHNGVMAQDLEKSKLGKQMVVDTPNGKTVDYGQGFSALMASIAELDKKVNKISKKKA